MTARALRSRIGTGQPSGLRRGMAGWASEAGQRALEDIQNLPLAALFTELFSPEVRYSGTSLGYQIGSILGGGLAPTAATGLYAAWGSSVPITGWWRSRCRASPASSRWPGGCPPSGR